MSFNVFGAMIKHSLQHRFPRALSFAQARLSPEGLYGLYLTIGALVLVGAVWLFGGIAEDLITGDPLVQVDAFVSEWLRSRVTLRLVAGAQWVSALASVTTISILCALMACALLWKRKWHRLLGLVSAVAGGMLLNLALKHLFDRARPGWADPLMALADPGFPSGHTMMATIAYGFLAVLLMPAIAAWSWRIMVPSGALLLVLLVAISRLALGAHYLSDVLGAMAAGAAWLALCLTAAETLRRRRI